MAKYFQVFKKKNHNKAAFAFATRVIEQYATFDDDKKMIHAEDAIHAYTFATEILAHSGLHYDAYQLAVDSWFGQILMNDEVQHMKLWCTFGKWILHMTKLTLQNDNEQGNKAAKIHFTQSRNVLRRLYSMFFRFLKNYDVACSPVTYFRGRLEIIERANQIIETMSLEVAFARKFGMLETKMIDDINAAMMVFEASIKDSFGKFGFSMTRFECLLKFLFFLFKRVFMTSTS